MTDTPPREDEFRVLVAAPTRRDGEITAELLSKEGVECIICSGPQQVANEMTSGVGVVVLTDSALGRRAMEALAQAYLEQPSWSDVPTLLLTRGALNSRASSLLERLGNVTLLERPSSTRAMVSAVQSALRARRKQYQIRDQLVEQKQADEALRQADKRKDAFLATLAHELRNPLAAIRTGLEVVIRHPGEQQRTQRVVGMLDRQSLMLVKLIDELMDVSRIATGKVVLQRVLLDLRSVLEASIETGQTAFDAAHHDIRLSIPSRPVWVMGDAARLTQVVGNLLNNAAKYTQSGGMISVGVVERDGQAEIRVEDNGLGIPSHLLGQVFEMFTQVDRTMERSQGGLGIGLSLVRRLVELHGGTVTAQSAGIDQGSTFVVSLPVAVLDESAETEGKVQTSSPVARRKVLIVDDNEDVAFGLAMLLEDDGHDIRVASDGTSALAEASTFEPDIVFCDIGMPGMGGHELAKRLRADPKHQSTLLVAVTGWGNDDDKRLSSEAGFDLHFTKPISYEQVELAFARLQGSPAHGF